MSLAKKKRWPLLCYFRKTSAAVAVAVVLPLLVGSVLSLQRTLWWIETTGRIEDQKRSAKEERLDRPFFELSQLENSANNQQINTNITLSRPTATENSTSTSTSTSTTLPANTIELGQSKCTLFNYSFKSSDLIRHHTNDCTTLQEMLDAIKYGERHHHQWDKTKNALNQTTDLELEKERHYSTFIPFKCHIPILNKQHICHLSNQFSHIVNLGDSLNRNLQYGLLMNWRGNVYNGSHLSSASVFNNKTKNIHCTCDAQFHKDCRPHSVSEWGQTLTPSELDVCSTQNDFVTTFSPQTPYNGNSLYTFQDLLPHCQSPNYKGVLIIANNGLHMRSKPDRVFNRYIVHWFNQPALRACVAQQKVYFIWNSFHAHSPSIDSIYPFQSRPHGLRFNIRMTQFFQHKITKVNNSNIRVDDTFDDSYRNSQVGGNLNSIIELDWFAMTKGAQTYDGIHSLTDVNYLKAQYVLQVAVLMKNQNHWLELPPNNITVLEPEFLCPILQEELVEEGDEVINDTSTMTTYTATNDSHVDKENQIMASLPWVTNRLSRKRYSRYRMKCSKIPKFEIGFRHNWQIDKVLQELKGRALPKWLQT